MKPHNEPRTSSDMYVDGRVKWMSSEPQSVCSTAEGGEATNVDDEMAFEEVTGEGDEAMSAGERKEGGENSVGGDEKDRSQCSLVTEAATIEKEETEYFNTRGSMLEGWLSEEDSVWYPSVTLEVMDSVPTSVGLLATHAGPPTARHDCDRCGKSFESAASRQLHKLTDHDLLARRYVCDGCGVIFFDKSVLARHVRGHHSETNHVRGHRSTTNHSRGHRVLTNHARGHRVSTNHDAAKGYPSNECEARFPKCHTVDGHRAESCVLPQYDLDHSQCVEYACNHSNCARSQYACEHSKCKLLQYACNHPGCERGFKQKGTLKRHWLTHGRRQTVHTCDILLCGKQFDCEDKLDRHLWITHSVNRAKKAHTCVHDACGQQFKREHDLRNHVESSHSATNPAAGKATVFICQVPFCKKTFSTKGNLKKHSYSHRDDTATGGKRTFACDGLDCGRVFKREGNLSSHVALVHSSRHGKNRFPCRAAGCRKRFTQKGNLNRHTMLIHAPEECKRVFPCDFPRCGKRFHLKCSLKMHWLVHDADSKIFACDKCGRRFSRKSSLKKHVLIHDETLCVRQVWEAVHTQVQAAQPCEGQTS